MGITGIIAPNLHFGKSEAEAAAGVEKNMSTYVINLWKTKGDAPIEGHPLFDEFSAWQSLRPKFDGTASLEDVFLLACMNAVFANSKKSPANITTFQPPGGWGLAFSACFEGDDTVVGISDKSTCYNIDGGMDVNADTGAFVFSVRAIVSQVLQRLADKGFTGLPVLPKPRPSVCAADGLTPRETVLIAVLRGIAKRAEQDGQFTIFRSRGVLGSIQWDECVSGNAKDPEDQQDVIEIRQRRDPKTRQIKGRIFTHKTPL